MQISSKTLNTIYNKHVRVFDSLRNLEMSMIGFKIKGMSMQSISPIKLERWQIMESKSK
jgi:hypothetical protein